MQIAARNAFTVGGGGWVNPYVTDGLIAMWDGEWNAGPGVHDSNATTWVDLAGGNNMTRSGCVIGDNYIQTATMSDIMEMSQSLSLSDVVAVEFVLKQDTVRVCFCFGFSGGNSTKYIAFRGTGNNLFFGNNRYNFSIPDSAMARSYSFSYQNETQVICDGSAISSSIRAGVFSFNDAGLNTYKSSYYFIGKMYCLRIYSRALTAAEIAANYAIDKQRFNLP